MGIAEHGYRYLEPGVLAQLNHHNIDRHRNQVVWLRNQGNFYFNFSLVRRGSYCMVPLPSHNQNLYLETYGVHTYFSQATRALHEQRNVKKKAVTCYFYNVVIPRGS